MYNYFTDTVLRIDAILLAACPLLSILIIVYAALQHRAAKIRNKGLLAIKQNVYRMVLSGTKPTPGTCQPLMEGITLKQYLDAATNRNVDAVFFNDAERNALRSCFDTPEKTQEQTKILLSRANKWRKIEAALTLGYLGDNYAVPAIRRLLYSKDEDTSYFAIIALGQIKTRASAEALIDCLRKKLDGKRKIVSVLEGFGPEIAKEAAVLLKEPDPAVRFWGLKLLAKLKPGEHLSQIERMVSDPSKEVRSAACECLGAVGGKSAQGALGTCLRDTEWSVRVSAVKSLVGMIGEQSIPLVITMIKDNSLSVIEAVRDALTTYIKSAIPYITGIFESDDILARKICSEAIVNSGYISTLISEALSGDNNISSPAKSILHELVKAGSHFGIENALLGLEGGTRASVIDIVRQANPALAEHIEKKDKGELQEL